MSGGQPRIGLLIPELTGGGAERVTVNLASALLDWGAAVDVIVVKAVGPYVADVPDGARLVELGTRGTATSILPLRRYLRDSRPHAVVSALHHANIALLLANRISNTQTRTVVTLHNAFSQQMTLASGLRARSLPALVRWTYPWADEIVAVSDGVADDFSRSVGFPRRRITTIYNPVVTQEMMQRAKEPPAHPWLRDEGGPVVVGIGRLTPQKDFATLIRAIYLLQNERPVRLLVLGEGPLRDDLVDLTVELGIQDEVDLPGFVENPYAILARADVFALSSQSEGLPTVLIEALALGTPVVSTRCESGPEEILRDGRYGRLVPVGRPEALAQAIRESLMNPLVVDPIEACARFMIDPARDDYLRAMGLDPDA